jgi:hypothetical protein
MKKTRSVKKQKHSIKAKSHVEQSQLESEKPLADSFSHRVLVNYAIPLARLVEAKLVSLQHRI